MEEGEEKEEDEGEEDEYKERGFFNVLCND